MMWGNFLALPCPLKKWDNDLKNYMLAFLPSAGLVTGLLWAAACVFLVWINTPFLIVAFLLTFLIFALCGFTHLDGFMDCCDAILSRRPIEDKQRILKDSNCGAFAVVSVVLMILGYYSAISTALSIGLDFVDLCLIPIISRAVSGANVILRKPMETSQYAHGKGAFDKGQKRTALVILAVQLLLFCGIGLYFATDIRNTSVTVLITALAGWLAAFIGKRKLGGMNGDIAGFAIIWSEFAGIFSMLIF